jgi:AGZA family xanthine/uracil permease-like MFS transporter
MQFALQIFQKPLVAMLPLAILFVALFSRVAFPLGLPAGLVAVVLGTACAWLLPGEWTGVPMSSTAVAQSLGNLGFMPPVWCGGEIAKVFALPAGEWLGFLTVIVPMGLFNVIGSLQNIESAAAAGDKYPTMPSMAINGVGSLLAALFGSCFPTTIYIGHAGWKGLGARAGYSTLNGVIITVICLSGALSTIAATVPVEAGMAIVLWIGIIITAQAFQTTPAAHAPACAIGLFPAIAAWGMNIVQGAFLVSGGKTLQDVLTTVAPPFQFALKTEVNGYLIHGMLVLERGYILTCMFLAAMAACLIDRQFLRASVWSLIAATCAAIGLTHSYQIRGNDIDYAFSFVGATVKGALVHHSWPQAIGYLALVVVFALFGWMQRRVGLKDAAGHD